MHRIAAALVLPPMDDPSRRSPTDPPPPPQLAFRLAVHSLAAFVHPTVRAPVSDGSRQVAVFPVAAAQAASESEGADPDAELDYAELARVQNVRGSSASRALPSGACSLTLYPHLCLVCVGVSVGVLSVDVRAPVPAPSDAHRETSGGRCPHV